MTKLISKDITNLPFAVDAIVNPSNNSLWLGSGVSGAIKERAGEDAERLQYEMYQLAPVETGQAVITKGYYGALKTGAIIHVVGPRAGMDNFETLLEAAYVSCFHVAMDNNIHSIAFPLISAGAFGGDELTSLRIALDVSKVFEPIMDIYIVKYVKNEN